MRVLLTGLVALIATSTSRGGDAAAPLESPAITRPNIVFIMSDDHGKQAISCYGASIAPGLVTTPGIDRIAREGIRFDRASVTNAICGPSRAVMLTGKHSHRNGFATNEKSFDSTQQTFPKLLQAAGYRTEVVGKWHLGSDPTGFDHFDVLVGQGDYWNPTFITDGVRIVREGHVTDIIHDRAIERLRALAKSDSSDGVRDDARTSQPFALLIHHKAPHRNWMPTQRHLQLFRDATITPPSTLFDTWVGRSRASAMQRMQVNRDLSWNYDLKVSGVALVNGDAEIPQETWMENELARVPLSVRETIRAAYAAENQALAARFPMMTPHQVTEWKFQRYAKDYLRTAQGVDDSVAAILAELDTLGLAANTIVIYTSDQGWFLGEHGWFDKRWMYEESFRMPLLVRWPNVIAAGSVSNAMVQNLDFAPTFLEAAGVTVPSDVQGKSMVGLLREPASKSASFRDAVYYRFEESKGPHTVPRHEGVATDRYKLIRFVDLAGASGAPLLELYDLHADPDEMTNHSENPLFSEVLASMLVRLESARDAVAAPIDAPPTPVQLGESAR